MKSWSYGSVKVHWLGHDGFALEGSRLVLIDPFKATGKFKADLLLVSHEHFDHLSPDDIKRLTTPSTKVIASEVCRDELSKVRSDVRYVRPGSKEVVDGVTVETIPAYNTSKFSGPGKVFHPKEDGRVGFVVTLDGSRFYHAGDTDQIPEMRNVDVDVAFLPVSGTYVMTAEEAAEAARSMRLKVAVPMHFGSIVGSTNDAERFKELLGPKLQVVILEKED